MKKNQIKSQLTFGVRYKGNELRNCNLNTSKVD